MKTPPIKQKSSAWNFGGKNFKLSRTKIELLFECPRCFYLDNKLGVGRPKGPPFSLNSAVDKLLKKEFDIHRAKQTTHPLLKTYGIEAVPFSHDELETWRETFEGIQYVHPETGLTISGAIDDLWRGSDGKLIVVDYKATSKDSEVNIDAEWQNAYKRQLEVYQWLLRRKGFEVSDTGYFVYCNGKTDKEAFDGVLEFDIKVIPYTGNDAWIEDAILKAHKCLTDERVPNQAPDCDFCLYRNSAEYVLGERKAHATKSKPEKESEKPLQALW
jgi:hypothetical protein